MIRDNLLLLAKTRIAPEDDDKAQERVSELCGTSLAGLTFCVFASLKQLKRALDEAAGFRVCDEKRVADGGEWSKIWKLRAVASDASSYDLWVWETTRDVTVLTVELKNVGERMKKSDAKAFKSLLG